MSDKYVKDRAHNKYPAYCCDDIDERVGALEAAVAALVAGTVPDGSVTLAKLANDARSYMREINKGRLISEWIGTNEEYEAHVAENGGEPLANVRYTITDVAKFAFVTAVDFPIGSIITVRRSIGADNIGATKTLYIGVKTNSNGETVFDSHAVIEDNASDGYTKQKLEGKWIFCGATASGWDYEDTASARAIHYLIYQRVE